MLFRSNWAEALFHVPNVIRHGYARMSAEGDRTAWLRMQPESNPSLNPFAPANLQKQEKFKNQVRRRPGLAKDTGFQQVGQRLPTSGSRGTAGQEQGKSRQEQARAGPSDHGWCHQASVCFVASCATSRQVRLHELLPERALDKVLAVRSSVTNSWAPISFTDANAGGGLNRRDGIGYFLCC